MHAGRVAVYNAQVHLHFAEVGIRSESFYRYASDILGDALRFYATIAHVSPRRGIDRIPAVFSRVY